MKHNLLIRLLMLVGAVVFSVNVWGDVTDQIGRTDFSSWGNSYSAHSIISKSSDAVYEIYATKSNKNINYQGGDMQLRSSDAYIVSTTSGGNIKTISISWADVSGGNNLSNTSVDVYGSNASFESSYYTNIKNGTKLGTISADGNAPINVSGNYKFVGVVANGACHISSISFTWGPSCTPAGTPLSITSANTVKTGKTLTLTSSGGNGGTVEWSVTNGTGTATINNGVLTAGNVGTVTVKAHQDQNGQTCETNAEQTVTISAITYTDYITECSSDPSISVSTAELSGFTYIYSQGPSTAKMVTVYGSYLDNGVTVTASDNYEICLSQDGTYTSTINLTPVDQMVNAPVYVRLKAGKDVNSYNGTLTVASAGLDSKTVTLSGSVVAPITVTLMDDNTELQQLTFGGSVNLPSRTTSCEGFTFVGWSETHVTAETAVKPTTINAGDYVPTTNIKLWPVFSKGSGTTAFAVANNLNDLKHDGIKVAICNKNSNLFLATDLSSVTAQNAASVASISASSKDLTLNANVIWTLHYDESQQYDYDWSFATSTSKTLSPTEDGLSKPFELYDGTDYWMIGEPSNSVFKVNYNYDSNNDYYRSIEYYADQSKWVLYKSTNNATDTWLLIEKTVGSSVYISTPECYETTITLDKGTNGQTDGSVTAAKGSATLSDYTAAVGPDHYHLLGYYVGDTKVIDANGQLVANAGSYTDANAKWQKQEATLTLTAQWEINTHSLTWTTDGDALTGDYTQGTVAYGTTIVQPNTPTKTGYTFNGWSNGSAVVVPGGSTMPDNDLSFTATWTINQYRVTWSINGDESQYADFDYNSALVLPTTDPESCDGEKVFVGWTKDEITKEPSEVPSDLFTTAGDKKVTASTTFYAVFANQDGEGGEETIYTFTAWDTWSSYLTKTHNDDQGKEWPVTASATTYNTEHWLGLKSDANVNSHIASPEFTSNVSKIVIHGKNGSTQGERTFYICSSNSTAAPTSGDLGFVTIPKKEGSSSDPDQEDDYEVALTGIEFNKFYVYVSNNLGVRSIQVTCGSATTYSDYVTTCAETYQISASTTNGSILWSLNGDEFGSTIGKQPEGRTVYFQLQPDLHYQVNGTPTSSDVEIKDEGSGIYSFTMPASAVTISASFTQKSTVTVTFTNNGETVSTQDVYVGEAIGELPEQGEMTPCDETSTTFMGWTDATITKQSSAPTMISSATIITTDQTYNAVWAQQTGEDEPVVQTAVTPSATFSSYYAGIDGKSGEDLRSALSTIISTNYSQVSYTNLKYLLKYADTDHANGSTIIDIYSDCSSTVSGDAITWVSSGRGLNREHTIPQSWFNEQSPMVSDAFHIYSVEAVANGNRGNTPYGECSGGSSSSLGSCSESGKLGSSTYADYIYNGIVYEPEDEYKGDIARGYFYMITRYMTSNFTQGGADSKACFTYADNKVEMTPYMLSLMLDWHNSDPVSEKELIRNEVIYGNPAYNPIYETYKQNNRNPFIDYPELIDYIWGDKSSTTVSLEDLTSAYGGGSGESSSFTDYLTQCAPTFIEINSHPANVTCYQDDDASLAIVATVNRGTLSYQWQSSTNGTDGWADIANATEATYKPSTTSIGITYYRCEVTSNLGLTDYSSPATVTVNQKQSNKYTITYAYQGWSTDPGEKVLEVDGGSTVTLPTLEYLDMTKEGYNFVKWEMSDGTFKQPDETFTMPTENIVISAVLEMIQQNISYTVNGSAAEQLTAWTTQPDKVNYWDEDLTAEYTITPGYHVSAAVVTVNDVALTESEYAVDNDMIYIEPSAGKFAGAVSITLTVEPMQYTVSLSADGATNTYTTQVEAIFGQDMPTPITLPEKPGYTFQGYSYTDQETSTTTLYYTSTGASARTWDIPAGATLTAQWSTDSYGITYSETANLTWGEKPATINIETDMLTANYSVTAGYEVTNMTVTVGGNAVAADDIDYNQTQVEIMTNFSGAVVITPTVTPIHYTITYLKNDGSATSSTQEAVYMANVTLKTGTAFNRKGYTIDHWETEDGQTSYAKGYTFEPYNLTSNLTLKAVWAVKESDWYTITFVDQLQDSEVDPINGILTVDGFTFPTLEDKDFSTAPPEDTGQCYVQHYHFMGWIADADKNGEITESNIIKGGTEVPAASVTANAMYYAIWATATIQ